MTTFGSCCYAECPNSYSTDSDDVFFKFPIEPGRRKKWLDNCGNPELTQLADRQLRGKRVCGRHFLPAAFVNPTTKEALTDKAVPIFYKPSDGQKHGSSASTGAATTDSDDDEASKTPDTGRRGRGRPRNKSSISIVTIKKEPEEVEDDDDDEYEPDDEPPSKGKATPKSVIVVATPKSVATPVNGTGAVIGRRSGLSRPSRTLVVSMKATEEHEKSFKAAVEKVERAKAEETQTPGPSGNRMTRRGKEVEKESGEIKTKVDVPSIPVDSAKTKMGLRKSLVARVAEEEKDRRATRLRAAKSESEEEPPTKKAKSPAPSPAPTAMSSRSKSPAAPVKTPIKSPVPTFMTSDIKSSLRNKGKVESGEESTSDKEVVETSAKDKNLPVVVVKKEIKTIEKFLAELKTHCILSEQWTLSGILWDPGHKMKMIAASEMDVTNSGMVRLKRCIQIFDDMTVKILIDDMIMTEHFETTKVTGVVDVAHLVSKVSMAKICHGIKTFEAQDTTYFPMVTKRGGCWYSADCPVIVDHNIPGPLCGSCARLRSSIRRRKIKEKIDLEKKQSKLLVRVQSKFGKALYTLLTDLMTENTSAVKKPFVPRPPVPQSSGVTVDVRAVNETDESSREVSRPSGVEGKNGIPSTTPKPTPIRKIKPKITSGVHEETPKQPKARTGPRGGRGKAALATASTPSGSNSFAHNDGQGEGVVEMLEQYVTIEGDNGNIILQPSGGEFTLAEGQEYELIGEADANEPMQVMDHENSHQTIEIIEVDDHTMAQLTGHNVNDMFFQGSENIQVTEIDPNDPNMGQLLKVIDPSQGFTFQ